MAAVDRCSTSEVSRVSDISSINAELPPHVAAAQVLIGRVLEPELAKELIVLLGSIAAITPDEAFLLMTANQLETA